MRRIIVGTLSQHHVILVVVVSERESSRGAKMTARQMQSVLVYFDVTMLSAIIRLSCDTAK